MTNKMKTGSIIKKRFAQKKIKKLEVLKLLATIMEKQQQQQESANGGESTEPKKGDQYESDFYTTGRIGRRNALPDILGNNYTTTKTSDLPLKFSALTTNDTPNQPGPSGTQPSPNNPKPN